MNSNSSTNGQAGAPILVEHFEMEGLSHAYLQMTATIQCSDVVYTETEANQFDHSGHHQKKPVSWLKSERLF